MAPTHEAPRGGEPDRATHLRSALERALGRRFTDGNRVERLRNGVEIFPAMLGAIRGARRSVELVTFVYWTGDVAEAFARALAERAAAGVRVRVLLDAYGSARMPEALLEEMRSSGVEVRVFRPIRLREMLTINHRTHRKVLVCDGEVAFTGGVGIAEEWEGDARGPQEWRETHFRLRGPCVGELQAVFLENWSEARGWDGVPEEPGASGGDSAGDTPVQVLRSSGGPGWSDVRTATCVLVEQARTSLTLATGYFVPDEEMLAALVDALRRGVRVEIMLPGAHTDQRLCNLAGAREMAALTEAGARVWLYQRTMLHHKLLLVDGVATMLGSPNFNQRSFEQDDEVAAIVLSEALAAQLEAEFGEDREHAEAFRAERWRKRSTWLRLKVWAARQVRGSL